MPKQDPIIAARVAKAHKTYVLNGRKVMSYLRANPGATNAEIRQATGHGPMRLQRMGVAKWKRVDGVTRWYLTGKIARADEEKKLEMEEQENEGPKWVRYTNT